jgi:very-short-patch-repair endonuclease
MYDRIRRARQLRRTMTEHEQFVWSKLRSRRFSDFKFRRQVPMGSYVADFVCLKQWLIIELDGGQHNAVEGRENDVTRDLWFRNQGFRVLRFWNHEVTEDWEAIEEQIWRELHRS